MDGKKDGRADGRTDGPIVRFVARRTVGFIMVAASLLHGRDARRYVRPLRDVQRSRVRQPAGHLAA